MMESDVLAILPFLGAQNIIGVFAHPEGRVALKERKRIQES